MNAPPAVVASRAIAVALLSAALLAACGKSPAAALEGMQEAAREGDADRFASYFTEDSAPFARALIAVYRTQSVAGGPASRPLQLLADSAVLEEKVEQSRAFLTVRTGKDGESKAKLVFRKEDGAWKLDIQETERLNTDSATP